MSGNWATGSEAMATRPAITMRIDRTMATTGRLTKKLPMNYLAPLGLVGVDVTPWGVEGAAEAGFLPAAGAGDFLVGLPFAASGSGGAGGSALGSAATSGVVPGLT